MEWKYFTADTEMNLFRHLPYFTTIQIAEILLLVRRKLSFSETGNSFSHRIDSSTASRVIRSTISAFFFWIRNSYPCQSEILSRMMIIFVIEERAELAIRIVVRQPMMYNLKPKK